MDSSKSNPNAIISFPGFAELKAEVEKLRTEISMLVLERDELLHIECRNIQMMYMLAVGGLEYKAYQMECQVLRLKRKAEMIQARKNRQEPVLLREIEDILDIEFLEYKNRLDEKINQVNAAIERSRSRALSDGEAAELKKLYRRIVKALHPDLHPEAGDARLTLFNNAVAAYKQGDLDGLRMICAMVAEPELPDSKQDGMAVMGEEKTRLRGLLKVLGDRIAQIKSKYPYTMKAFVNDAEQVAARKAELEDAIAQWRDALSAHTAKIDQMLR